MVQRREHRNAARVALARLYVDLPKAEDAPDDDRPASVEASVVTGNISLGGVGFVLPAAAPRPEAGDRLTVRFQLPDSFDELVVRVEVRHAAPREDGSCRVGAAFLDADELVENPLFRYVEESLLAVRATSESFIEGP
jgi:c-di-GMP-binding flagellar brake protein YcgR